MPLTLALRLQQRVVDVPGGGASLRVRPPTVSEALLLLAAAERSVSPALADELRVSAAADLEDLAEAWLPEAVARAVLSAPVGEKAGLLLPLLEDADDPYAEQPAAPDGEQGRAEERMQNLLALDWDRLILDVAALHHATPVDVLGWPWGVFLYLVGDLPRHEARLQYRHAVAAIAGQSAEVLDSISRMAQGLGPDANNDVVITTTTDPEVLAANRARLREAMGASATPPPAMAPPPPFDP